MNENPIRGEYTFTLLIPEDEVFISDNTYKKEAVEKLKALATIRLSSVREVCLC